jgi:hypothetical protein
MNFFLKEPLRMDCTGDGDWHQISGNPAGEILDAILLECVAIRFGCQHGLQFTKEFGLVRYYNALAWILVPRRGRRTLCILA